MLKPVVAIAAAAALQAGCSGGEPWRGQGDRMAGRTYAAMQLAELHRAAIASPLRPADEVARDPMRHPDRMLAFAQVQPGWKVADIRPGAGYFTRLFAPVVGDTGKVYAFVPNRTAERHEEKLLDQDPALSRLSRANQARRFCISRSKPRSTGR